MADIQDLHYCVNKLEELYEDQEYDRMKAYLERVKEITEELVEHK